MNAEQLKSWREAGREFLAADGAPSSVNAEQRTINVCWFTGVDVPRLDWWTGDAYTLRFDPAGADLSLLNNGAPVLDNHDQYEGAAGQMGRVEKAWADNGNYFATLRFSKRPEVDGLWQDLADRIVTKFSMGVELLETVETRDQAGKLQVKTATKWRPFELSVAPIPADFGTTTLSAAPAANDVLRATAQIEQEAPMETQTQTTGGEPVNAEALRAEGARLERERLSAIRATAEPFLQRGEIDRALLSQFEAENGTLEGLRAAILERLAQRSAETPIAGQHTGVAILRDEVGTRRELMSAAILNRIDPGRHQVDDQNDFRRMSCLRMAEESLSRGGVRVRGLAASEVAHLAMQATADFTSVLENTARKRLLVAYQMVTPTYQLWAAPSTTPDFKTMSRLRLSETPSFLQVAEGAQITIGTMSDSKETYALATYGRGVSFTRQMLINDDLGAFNNLLFAFGLQASRLENKTVYSVLTANAAMSDSVALFHASHANLGTGVIANTALDAMFTAMGTQKGLDAATVIDMTPTFLIVPKAKESTARAAMQATGPNLATASQNWFAGRLTVVADGELDGTSTAEWYAAADPKIFPGIEYAHLEGASGPQIVRKDNESGILGVQLYAYLDFGAKAVDYKPLYKSSGA